MKKLPLLLVLVAFLTCYSSTASAESLPQYVRVTEEGVNFYADASAVKTVCTLEKSYYLEVIGEENDCYVVTLMGNSVSFPKICGYVAKNSVEICQKEPILPLYPTVTATVDGSNASLKLSPSPNAKTVVVATNSQKMSYYGTVSEQGKTWYYVYYCGCFGYVESKDVFLPAFAMHPTPLAEKVVPTVTVPTSEDVDESPSDVTFERSSGAEIALIAFVCLLAGSLVLALFLPSKNHQGG